MMNRKDRRNAMKQGNEVLKTASQELQYFKQREKASRRVISTLEETVIGQEQDLVKARTLIAQLTAQIEESGRSYMWTLGAIAKANGGEIRIPCSAIDSVQEDDILENRLDEFRNEIVFTIRPKGTDAPSGIILPGRAQ